MIAESLHASVDVDGNQHLLFEEIIYHKKNKSVVTIYNKYMSSKTYVTPDQGGSPLVESSPLSGRMALHPGYH